MDSTGIAVAVSIGVVALLITVFGMSMIMVHWFRVTSFDKTKEPPCKFFVISNLYLLNTCSVSSR